MLFLHPNGPGGVHADHHHHQEQGLVMSTMDCHLRLLRLFWPSPLVHTIINCDCISFATSCSALGRIARSPSPPVQGITTYIDIAFPDHKNMQQKERFPVQ